MNDRPNYFVALPVSLGDWYETFKNTVPHNLKISSAVDLHITVSFLGNISPDISKKLCTVLQNIDPVCFDFSLATLMPLPSKRHFSALSFSLNVGREQISRYMSTHRNTFHNIAGTQPDHRGPLPHITVARPQKRATVQERSGILDWMQTVSPPQLTFKTGKLSLYTWADDRKKKQYERVF